MIYNIRCRHLDISYLILKNCFYVYDIITKTTKLIYHNVTKF